MTRLEYILGAALACYFLVGRWSPSRLIDGEDPSLVWQPRLWLVLLIAMLGMVRLIQQFSPTRGAKCRTALQNGLSVYPRGDLVQVAMVGLLLQLYMAASVLWTSWAASDSPKCSEALLLIVVQLSVMPLLFDGDLALLRDTFWRAMMWLVYPIGIVAVSGVTAGERAAALGGGSNAFGRNMGLLMLGSLYLLERHRSPRAVVGRALFPRRSTRPPTIDGRVTRTSTSRPQGRRLLRAVCYVVAMVLGGMLVVMSGSRGAMVSAMCGFAVLFLLRRGFQLRAIMRWSIVPVIACVILFTTDLGVAIINMFERRVVVQTIQDRYTAERGELFRQSVEAGLENPLCGVGLDAFRARRGEYPHNFFLEPFAEGGVPGLLLAVGMIVLAVYRLWRRRRVAHHTTVAAFAVVLTAAQFSGDLYDSRGVFLFSLLALLPAERMSNLRGRPAVDPHRKSISFPGATRSSPLGIHAS